MLSNEYNLNDDIYRLLNGSDDIKAEPFFASISREINKRSTKTIPTAGVQITSDHQFELLYNPNFMKSLTSKEKLAILKHEFYHLILGHVTTRQPADELQNMQWNFATDLAINSFLVNEIPKNGMIPGKGFFKNYPLLKSAEWYFSVLDKDDRIKKIHINEENGKNLGQIDDHSNWGKGSKSSSDDNKNKSNNISNNVAQERLKNILRKATNEAIFKEQGWGSITSDIKQEIIAMIETKIDWKKVLRYFIKTSQRSDRSSTVRKINKRYPMIHPGKKINRIASIAISIDQSGSVSDNLLAMFFAELNKLKNLATFTVIPFDHEVAIDDIYEWKKGSTHKCERVKCGGTCFDAPSKYVNERNFDGHIILTDLYAPKPIASRCQRIWMTSIENANQPYFQTHEKIIPID